ncbi:DUF3027 domain-containing protein [Microbacterium oleivorans]
MPESAPLDERLLTAHDLARAALAEVTPATTVGEPVDYVDEGDGVVSLRFANRLPGYPGWLWTVSVAVVEDAEPTVLEVELLPAVGALLAPDWTPWAVRLAEYQAAQAATDEDESDDADESDESADLDEDEDDLADDEDADDEDADDEDYVEDSTAVTHAGDVDGVDIDALDDSDDDDDDDDDESDDEDDDDESVHDEAPNER